MKPASCLQSSLLTAVAPDPAAVVERLAALDRKVSAVDLQLLLIQQRLAALSPSLPVETVLAPALLSQFGTWFAALGSRAQARPLATAGPAGSPVP
jgi:hypothetical protein